MNGACIDVLRKGRSLSDDGLRYLLETEEADVVRDLHAAAREVTDVSFGRTVWLRALIEWSNVCRNDCLYCGIRRSNGAVRRYSLGTEEILSCCGKAWDAGLRTFVLQGGEQPAAAAGLAPVIAEIRASWPGAAITLSLGELPAETYALLRWSGADRYLLRHETASEAHYARLHPAGMSLRTRLDCLRTLQSLGYQTGMGMMVGSPYQTTEDLVADLRLLEGFRPAMVGIGPFIPQADTPFGGFPAGGADRTLRLYSIVRLMFPKVMMPATTALSTLLPEGWTAALSAGANVIMPDFTPPEYRGDYALYEGKTGPRVESAANLSRLKERLSAAGYRIGAGRGDYNEN